MPTFQYRALTQVGEVVTGSLDATRLAEVNRRVEYLGLIPIEAATARNDAKFASSALASLRLTGPRAEDVTIFTADLALLLHTGARINDALELLASDAEMNGQPRRRSRVPFCPETASARRSPNIPGFSRQYTWR